MLLARALVIEPSVLLFDEPLSNLDAKLRVSMRTEIRRIQQEVGITAIYVTTTSPRPWPCRTTSSS